MKESILSILMIGCVSVLLACNPEVKDKDIKNQNPVNMETVSNAETDTITFGSGCFWCTEAIFESLNGVISAESGYMGGSVKNPTYKQVCTGETGHAEVVRIIYDPKLISFDELLEAFWASHDPTTLNRQGNDVGTQYRSVIFYYNDTQKTTAVQTKNELNEKKVFDSPIVTLIEPASDFYIAENYHQQYFELNGSEPYCSFVIKPKLDKFRKHFADKMKK